MQKNVENLLTLYYLVQDYWGDCDLARSLWKELNEYLRDDNSTRMKWFYSESPHSC